MQSPRTRYQLSKQDVEWHKRLVQSIEFERAADAAMLEVAGHSSDYIAGAKDYQNAFESLSNVPIPPAPVADTKNVL